MSFGAGLEAWPVDALCAPALTQSELLPACICFSVAYMRLLLHVVVAFLVVIECDLMHCCCAVVHQLFDVLTVSRIT